MIGVIDYGMGNLMSIKRMVEKFGKKSVFISSPNDLSRADKLLLPGVGHFGAGIRALHCTRLWDPLLRRIQEEKITVMGICLGMQLLTKYSEEGHVRGLGLIDAIVRKFNFSPTETLKVPHMGWNTVRPLRVNPLLPMDGEDRRFYFVHSYKVVPTNSDISIANCDYGGEFCAAFQQGNIFGVQFHPEKSHRFGIDLFNRFINI